MVDSRQATVATTVAASTLDVPLDIGGVEFTSRLIVGTGKYENNEIMVAAIRASGAEMVTEEFGLFSTNKQVGRLATLGCFAIDESPDSFRVPVIEHPQFGAGFGCGGRSGCGGTV